MDSGHRNATRWPNHTLLTYTLPANSQGEGKRGPLSDLTLRRLHWSLEGFFLRCPTQKLKLRRNSIDSRETNSNLFIENFYDSFRTSDSWQKPLRASGQDTVPARVHARIEFTAGTTTYLCNHLTLPLHEKLCKRFWQRGITTDAKVTQTLLRTASCHA